jgi:hypothetical protein
LLQITGGPLGLWLLIFNFFLSVEVEVTGFFEGAESEAKEVKGRNEEVDEGDSIASQSCRIGISTKLRVIVEFLSVRMGI